MEVGLGLGIEEYIPSGRANKPFWARGEDMLGYSLNALRTAHLEFVDAAGSPPLLSLGEAMLSSDHTSPSSSPWRPVFMKLQACHARNMKLCAALAAAAMIPARFYHSVITNSRDVNREDELWELAQMCYKSYADAKNNNKHLSDMSDLNFLMVKAIENPGLTPSSAQRNALVSVFEDVLIGHTNDLHSLLGVEDFVGCASVHSVGPSLAIFDTIRNGELDCACVYPSPMHSRDQMHKLVDDIKRILVDAL
ncbi:unnamed protein product [Linum tenue]|uniref:Uncharacterized protein n=1 Tax=Linum tenue TaxID=586396 RepID=A0AAV0NU60_9ROSI|nr:unnamed protein product [Linum tenue]